MKKNYINIALILALSIAPFALAEDSNNLVQLDLKKSSNSSVDVTLVTSENYGDNVMVRKKSDNKYVILIPKVKSSGYSASNLAGVRDLVSDVDVKTVDDTSGGYTKVTLITTKPLDIKTRTAKSTPVTAEQQEYNTLIAQANSVKNSIATPQVPKIREQKTEVTVNKAPKITQEESKPTKIELKKIEKPKIELTEITPDAIEKQNRQNRKNHLAEMRKEALQDKALEELPQVPVTAPTEVKETVPEIAEMPVAQKIPRESKLHKIKVLLAKVAHKIPRKAAKTVGLGVLGFIGLIILSKLFKKSIKNIQEAGSPYTVNLEENRPIRLQSFDKIMNNRELTWKEKYNMYLDKSAKPVQRADGKGKYTFIKTPAYMEQKRQKLEQMVSEVQNDNVNSYSEDNSIAKTIKFRAFEHNLNNLSMSNRHYSGSRFKKYEVEIPLQEQKTIVLDDYPLGSNPRSLKGANLKVSDVDKKRIKYEPKDYIMSSVDEYLSILDSEKPVAPQTTPVTTPTATPVKSASNPIARNKAEMRPKNEGFFKGSVVKSGFKIAPNKGIYLVNKGGKNTLVGKVNDKITILKNFDGNVTNPIQVRHDKANVYMVKAGNFKSLVEVKDNDMGVLIEL